MNNKEKQNKEKSSRGVSKIAAIIGFSLVGLAALTLICTMLITFISSNNMVSESELSTFKNEKEIEARLKTVIKNSGKLYSSDANYIKDIIGSPQPLSDTSDSIVDGDQAVIGQASYSDVSSEDEADTVKTDDRYIYFLSSGGSKISIFSAEGENSKLVSEINITNKETETFQFADFFLKGKKLIAVEEAKVSVSAEDARAYTRVEVFDLSDIQKIKPAESFIQSGAYSASRMTDDILYIVSTHHAANEKDLPCAVYGDKTVSTDDKNNPDRIPAEDIYSVDEPDEPNFTVISKMDTSIVENSLSSKAVFGTSGGAYFGSKSLYLTAYKYDENLFNKQNSDDASYIHLPVSETKVVKVNLSDELSFADTAKISGYIDSSYSFDEKDSVLRVVSVKTLDNDKFTESANIFVLDKDMKCIGKVTDFSNNESIRTVRYIDDTAYVIAYKTPSPLFIIDLKNNNEPKILGETKINGFSPTLVPIDDKTLLSVGFYTAKENDKDSDGIKLVTFDISNKANPKKIDEKILKNYESPVQYNQNALLIDSVKNDYIMPMLYENYNSADESYETKCGILNFKVENGKINIVNDYTSTIFQSSDENSVSVDRCVTTGDWVYLLGSDVSYYNADGNALIEAVKK